MVYSIPSDTKNYSEALIRCTNDFGGQLAFPKNKEEHDKMVKKVNDEKRNDVFIGVKDTNDTPEGLTYEGMSNEKSQVQNYIIVYS